MQPANRLARAPLAEGGTQTETTPEGFQVKINGVSLVDLLQMFHLSRRSLTLKLREGTLHIREGEVIHAEFGELSGEPAVRKLLELRGGELQTEHLVSTPVSVRRPLASVLLDALVSLDEANEEISFLADKKANDDFEAPMPAPRPSQLDAICGSISRNIEGAQCCVIVDLDRGILLGCDAQPPPQHLAMEVLLDTALDLFSRGQFPTLESLLAEDGLYEREPDSATHEVWVHRGERLYLGKRLNENSAVLLITDARQCPTVHLAELRATLARGVSTMPEPIQGRI